jgi:hypothetical protein
MVGVDVIRDLIGGGLVAYNRPVAARFGVNAAILMHELAYWCNRSVDDWCYRTQEEIQESTGLRVEGQNGARKVLRDSGVLLEERKGVPARIYYSIDWDAFVRCLSGPELVPVITGTRNGNSRNLLPENPEHTYKASNTKQVNKQVSGERKERKPSAKTVEELPRNGAAQTLVAVWCERTGAVPVSYPVAAGHAKNLAAAGVDPAELGALYDYLANDPFWTGKGFDLGTAVSQLEKFRQAKRKQSAAPKFESAFDFVARRATSRELR